MRDRHFDIARQAAQDFAHSWSRSRAVQAGALDAMVRGHSEVDFLAAGAAVRIESELGQPSHVAHIVCGQPHLTLNAS